MKVILNADDFGSSERHSLAILDLIQKGRISSTTMLVNLDYSEVAARMIRESHPELEARIGLHFNLIEGLPLNPKLLKSPFVVPDGTFKDYRGRVSFWRILPWIGDLRVEIDLQAQRFEHLMGFRPSHIDAHGHTHCSFLLIWAFFLSKEARRIGKIRLTREYDHEAGRLGGLRNKFANIARAGFNYLLGFRFKTTQFFTDIRRLDGGWIRPEDLQLLAGRHDLIEVMCHPFMFDLSEYHYLEGSDNVFQKVTGIELVGYDAV